MADSQDEIMERLAAHLSRTYKGLALACLHLPVPITLEVTGATNVTAIPAVRRIMDVTIDQPMPEEHQANLFSVCAYWLGAMDLVGILATAEFHTARAHSAFACLLMADQVLLDLAGWLGSLDD
ncbi:hypothetical protein [Streptomyces sp. NBC_00198]|uniref:hypothetical protein n=1 Tax=Streptomyces sp. NBC_00198 TaxID=2975677 RepID=UPI00224F671D|nr:hypothetical protein [Streptomyces sp. NBC_00198]MCX5286235.1 hypothetical protein [Streptomyces sp. NBC_00198]